MIPSIYNIEEINFVRDFTFILENELKSKGYNIKETNKYSDILFSFFNLKRRLVYPKPRKVLISKEFKCPPELKKNLDLLKSKIENGENIYPHLSKKIFTDINYHDGLLNDWDIHHLHLGITPDKKEPRFVERTGPLLYVRFDDNNAYFINIYCHGSWCKQEMIKILHNNWPESIEIFRLKDAISAKPKSDKEYSLIRKNNALSLVEIEKGVVYFPIGMGYMSSGHSFKAIKHSDYCIDTLNDYEKYFKNNFSHIISLMKKNNIKISSDKVKFYPYIIDNKIYVHEIYSNVRIELGDFL